MNNQEFKTLRKSCFKTAKEAAKYFNTPYETWKSWESGKRRVPGIAVKSIRLVAVLIEADKKVDAVILLMQENKRP